MIPNDPRIAFNRAQTLVFDPRHQNEAFSLYQQCAQDRRAEPCLRASAIVGAGLVMEHAGRHAAARDFYNLALEMDPACVSAWMNIATLDVFEGHVDKARHFLEWMVEAKPDVWEAKYNLALVLLLLGEYERGWNLYRHRPSAREAA